MFNLFSKINTTLNISFNIFQQRPSFLFFNTSHDMGKSLLCMIPLKTATPSLVLHM